MTRQRLSLEEQVSRARGHLVTMHRDGDLDRDDLDQMLSDAGMEPYGETYQVEVVLRFKLGAESEAELAGLSLDGEIVSMLESYNEELGSGEPMILEPEDGWTVSFGQIQRGNLPS